eukprot:6483826-Amphidinium_carterae.3
MAFRGVGTVSVADGRVTGANCAGGQKADDHESFQMDIVLMWHMTQLKAPKQLPDNLAVTLVTNFDFLPW